jgi:hypothetical protein
MSTATGTGLTAAASLVAGRTAMNTETNVSPAPAGSRSMPTDEELREISASLRGMRYGSVNIVVQDGVIIQIDRTEKKRLRTRRDSGESPRT